MPSGAWIKFRDALLWAQALDRYARLQFEPSIQKLCAIRGPRRHASEYFALLGSAHLALGQGEGRDFLNCALTQSAPTRREYRDYVEAYCRYHLALLDGDEGASVKWFERAVRMQAPRVIRQWLPLS